MKFNGKWKKKKWVSYTIATCSAVLLYTFIAHLPEIVSGVGSFFRFVKPVVTGMIIAYIFNPVSKFFESKIFKKIKKEKTRWGLSVALSIIVILAAIILLFVALIPQLVDSVSYFVSNVGDYVNSLQVLLHSLENDSSSGIFGADIGKLADIGDKILSNISNYFSSNVGSVVNKSASIGKGVFDVVISFILAIYFLLAKHGLRDRITSFLGLVMKEENYKNAGDFIRRCNDIMVRYIVFDLVDGIVVGFVNFIFMLIAGMPYSVLISVIVGVTNLAPTFGPIIGALIGGFILVLVNPLYGLSFLIFTAILQTIDGYVLKPRLFGEGLGVSPLMVLIFIVLGGRLFGVGGVLIAIPVSAIIDFTWRDFVLKKLEEKRAKRYNI
jgi:predicted PurR-regulated permease PerM